MKKFAFFCSVLMSIAVLFTACPPQPGSNSEVASLELKPTEVSMKVNDVRRLSFFAKDKDGNAVDAANVELEWVSSNEEVATVSSNGTITAVAQGAAVVTATVKNSNVSATCNVNVLDRASYTIFDNASCLGYSRDFAYPYTWKDRDSVEHQDSLLRPLFYVFNQDMYFDAVNSNVVGTGGYGMFFATNNIYSPSENAIYSLGEYMITEEPETFNDPATSDVIAEPHQIVCGHFDTDAWTAFFDAALSGQEVSWDQYPLYPEGDLELMLWFAPDEEGSPMTYMNCGYVYGEGIMSINAKEGSKMTDPLVVEYYDFKARIIDVENAYGFETRPGDPETNPEESADEEYFVVPLTMKPMREFHFVYGEIPTEAPARAISMGNLKRNADFFKSINVVNVNKLRNENLVYNK